MPKMKTDKGAAARVKITGTGRLRRRHAMRSHLLEKKPSKRTRRLGREGTSRRRTSARYGGCSVAERCRRASGGPRWSRDPQRQGVQFLRRGDPKLDRNMSTAWTAFRQSRHRHLRVCHRGPSVKGVPHGESQTCGPRSQASPRSPRKGRGLLREPQPNLQVRQRGGAALVAVRVPRPPGAQGRLPPALDTADQRRCRENGTNYSQFVSGLKRKGVEVDRKVLADLAVMDPEAFSHLVVVATDGTEGSGITGSQSSTARRVVAADAGSELLTVRLGLRHQRVQRLRRLLQRRSPRGAETAPSSQKVRSFSTAHWMPVRPSKRFTSPLERSVRPGSANRWNGP